MKRFFTLEYWEDDGWFVGRLKEVPGVFSQGESLEALKENIIDAYRMMLAEYEADDKQAGVKCTETAPRPSRRWRGRFTLDPASAHVYDAGAGLAMMSARRTLYRPGDGAAAVQLTGSLP